MNKLLHYLKRAIFGINGFRINRIIKKRANNKGFFVFQIGAADGIASDPIRKYILRYKWGGVIDRAG